MRKNVAFISIKHNNASVPQKTSCKVKFQKADNFVGEFSCCHGQLIDKWNAKVDTRQH